ncbi:ATP-binding protein [Dactylosporangium sp. NPDC000521]|uniref:caspase, EACC1-associated type n=1 Tax=Dactylosporangium sp. NPDC000521 TaxID=3363975 RepID=UPI0036ACAD99
MRGRAPAPELPPGPRFALVIATATYADPALSQLRAPAHDAAGLAEVLADPAIGAFAVSSLIDRTAHDIRVEVEDFLTGREPDDLVVVYLSCHGVRDRRGRLYFAATDSRTTHLGSTGIESRWLLEQLDECRARQVVILDCCFSGAFSDGAKGEPEVNLERHLIGSSGRGRAVLTASRAGEYSFEGEVLPGALVAGSVFTTGMIEGLRSGDADTDRDGYICVDDAYAYAFEYVRRRQAAQTPQRWIFGGEGKIVLARSLAGAVIKPVPLPASLRTALDSQHPEVRLGAVTTLGQWLGGSPGRAVTARRVLEELAGQEIPPVVAAARALLSAHPADAGPDEPPAPQDGTLDLQSVHAARAEAEQIVGAAQQEYDEIIAEAKAQVEAATLARAKAEQDAVLAVHAAEQAEQRLRAAEQAADEAKAEAAAIGEEVAHLRALRTASMNEAAARKETAARRHREVTRGPMGSRAAAGRLLGDDVDGPPPPVPFPHPAWEPSGLDLPPQPGLLTEGRGYDPAAVDEYFDRARAALTAGSVLIPDPPVFPSVRRGYHPGAVDLYVHLLRTTAALRGAEAQAMTSKVFGTMVRRSQYLGLRLRTVLHQLTDREQDPDRLTELLRLDHLSGRIRRSGETLLALAGADPLRSRHEPASVADVLLSAQSEIEDFTRLRFMVFDRRANIAGFAVFDVVHLIAELLDNATTFSPPDAMVDVTARRIGDGLHITVEDAGIGISPGHLLELNDQLTRPGPPSSNRMVGLYAVSHLAARHGITVRLFPTPAGGTVADVRIPAQLLV